MSEFLRIITHARRFRSALRELGIEQLEEIKKKLDKIIEDRKLEDEKEAAENAEKIEKIKKFQEALAAEGISLDDLQGDGGSRVGSRGSKPPKYEIWNEAGQRVTWTGQGRMPNIFKARIEEGEPLETFLID